MRGEYIKNCTNRDQHTCFWDSICDVSQRRVLDLSNPFVRLPKWKPLAEKKRVSEDPMHLLFDIHRPGG